GIQQIGSSVPENYMLYQNYPNPFNPTTNIKFGIPKAGNVKLVVFDILGREVATIVNNEFRDVGTYTVTFDASHLSSGVYFYRLESGDFSQTKKMLLVK
ncbi:MAG: T9SS type A sorting domain-containing protein, partial [Ignavibacteria bacterium]|nr:T9SS type A sorting domain-containing protein [Ignavibacteria bacterium]